MAKALPPQIRKEKRKMTVYIVWYKMSLGTAMWAVYGDEEKAKDAVAGIIEGQFGTEAWYNEEEVR